MASQEPDQTSDPPRYARYGRYGVFTIERLTQLEPHIDAWSRLVSSASSPNVYYTPEFLIPNLEHVERRPFVLLLIYEEAPAENGHTLVAFAPFTVNAPNRRRPFVHLETLTNKYAFGVNPLIDPRHADAAWHVLLQVLQDPAQPWQLTDLELEPESGEPPAVLVEELAATRTIVCWRGSARAWLHKPFTFGELVRSLGGKAWRNHLRRLKQLAEHGEVELKLHRRCEDVDAFVDDFLALELSGWKGSRGTAMASTKRDADFLHHVARNFNAKAGLFYIELRVDGRTVAVSLAHTQGTAMFAFKIAYDEALSRFSPGVIVAIETIHRFIQDAHLTTGHSGTSVDSWAGRYFVGTLESYNFCLPTRRPLALAFSWTLKMLRRLRRVEIGRELAARHRESLE